MSYLSVVQGKGGISAKVVAASISTSGKKLTTLELRYPRWILAELNAHRMLSRNSASSRAIPVERFIEQVRYDPATPIHWGLNQAGMQAQDLEVSLGWANNWWKRASLCALLFAEEAQEHKLHKQIANRILEPWQFMTTLVSATEWDNFFEQRISPAAQPEICELALCMQEAMEQADYTETLWHLPYITTSEEELSFEDQKKVSVARCCRVSYNRQGVNQSYVSEDLRRHSALLESGHWSPFEHIAVALTDVKYRSGNFRGWHQYRNIVQGINPVTVTEVPF